MKSFLFSARRCVSLVLTAGALTVASSGCKKEDAPPAVSAAPTAPAAPKADRTYSFEGITFQYPAGWKIEPVPEQKAVNVVAPSDGGWDPNVYLRIQDGGNEELTDLMDTNIDLLRGRKQSFLIKTRKELDHPAGFRYGRVEYTNQEDASGANLPLTQLSIIAPLPNKKRLTIQAAAASSVWENYQPKFDKIIDSVKQK